MYNLALLAFDSYFVVVQRRDFCVTSHLDRYNLALLAFDRGELDRADALLREVGGCCGWCGRCGRMGVMGVMGG